MEALASHEFETRAHRLYSCTFSDDTMRRDGEMRPDHVLYCTTVRHLDCCDEWKARKVLFGGIVWLQRSAVRLSGKLHLVVYCYEVHWVEACSPPGYETGIPNHTHLLGDALRRSCE